MGKFSYKGQAPKSTGVRKSVLYRHLHLIYSTLAVNALEAILAIGLSPRAVSPAGKASIRSSSRNAKARANSLGEARMGASK